MTSFWKNLNRPAFLFCAAAMLSGCATTPKQAIRLDPNFDKRNISTVVLMPIVDRRIDKKAGIDLEKDIRKPAKEILQKKGYTVTMPARFLDGSDIASKDVGEMNADDLAGLGPADAKTLLFIYLDDLLEDYAVIAYTVKVEETGSLIDKGEKIELWRDKGIGSSGQAGLISGVLSGMDKSLAISNALYHMLDSFPPRSRPVTSKSTASSEDSNKAKTLAKPIQAPLVNQGISP